MGVQAICLSLGGTKLQVGALTEKNGFVSSPEIVWRSEKTFQECMDDPSSQRFCQALAWFIQEFLDQHGLSLAEVGIVGVPFPGPHTGRLWFSNNLTAAFRNGVDLEAELSVALSRLSSASLPPRVKVVFDAQCDAGGELYHPLGRLQGKGDSEGANATVLNIATGIAAGFVENNQVLIEDADFKRVVDVRYDAGAGQLGRHLWYFHDERLWRYCFLPFGQTPVIKDATRMTDRLSGPALAGRLLYRLGQSGLLESDDWVSSDVPFSVISSVHKPISGKNLETDCAEIACMIRASQLPLATALLHWADERMASSEPSRFGYVLQAFCQEVSRELAAALNTWLVAPGWRKFGRRIVLTGGVGIWFLASTDYSADPSHAFPKLLEAELPPGCQVWRSRLSSATEREIRLFVHLND